MGFESAATYCAIRVHHTSHELQMRILWPRKVQQSGRGRTEASLQREKGQMFAAGFFHRFMHKCPVSVIRTWSVWGSLSAPLKRKTTQDPSNFQYSSSHFQREGAQECSFYQARLPRRLRCKWRADAVLSVFLTSGLRQPLPNRKPIDSSFMVKTGRVVRDFQCSWMQKWPWPLR